jgi:hypothetical protein
MRVSNEARLLARRGDHGTIWSPAYLRACLGRDGISYPAWHLREKLEAHQPGEPPQLGTAGRSQSAGRSIGGPAQLAVAEPAGRAAVGQADLGDLWVENRLGTRLETVGGQSSLLQRSAQNDLVGQVGRTSLRGSRVQNQRGNGVGSWMDGSSLWCSGRKNRSGRVQELRINRPVKIGLLGLGDTTLRKDFGQQPRQELSGHNDKRRVKLLVLVKDDIGIIVADDLVISVAKAGSQAG